MVIVISPNVRLGVRPIDFAYGVATMVEVENPGTKEVSSLIENVNDGSYVIPYFQRGFEWEPSMVSELFESILQNYYTGLLLFWDLDDENAAAEHWDPVWGATANDEPEKAILDGQQRLSSLYYAIHNPKRKFPNRKSYYVFYVDLVEAFNEEYEEAVTYSWNTKNYDSWSALRSNRDRWIESGEVPLCILSASDPDDPNDRYIDSDEFEEWAQRFIDDREEDLPDVSAFDVYKLFNGILSYDFVVYPLGSDRSMPDICNIFAKVNDTGMKLSTFDLMNAFLYPHGVNLRKDLWEELGNESLKRMDSNMDENLLKVISLRKQNYCSSKYLYNLIPGEETVREEPDGTRYEEILVESGTEFEELWWGAERYAEKARAKMMNTGTDEFGAIRGEFVPYNTMLPVLAAVLWEYEEQSPSKVDNLEFPKMLRQWYWSAVFSQDYSGSSDTAMGKDFRDWKSWLYDGQEIEQIAKVDEEFINEMDLATEDKGTGRYNAVICLLALNGAEDFYKGRTLGTGDFTEGGINDHHIFPKKVSDLPPETSTNFDRFKDSILNRTLILDETNNKIKNSKPSTYLQEMESRHEGRDEVSQLLKKHFVTEKGYQYLRDDDFDNFIKEREQEIKRYLIRSCIR